MVCLGFPIGLTVAADRGHGINVEHNDGPDTSSRSAQTELNGLPVKWLRTVKPGTLPDYAIFRQEDVFHGDGDTGIISMDIDGKIIRVLSTSREIADVSG